MFPLPPGQHASTVVYRRVTPSIKFAGTHLYTRVERGTVRVKCLAQEHNTTSLARAQTQTARSGVEHNNPAGGNFAPQKWFSLTRRNQGKTKAVYSRFLFTYTY